LQRPPEILEGAICLSRPWKKSRSADLSRRKFLQYCQGASLALLPAGISFRSFLPNSASPIAFEPSEMPGELQLHPEYRLKRGIEAMLRKLPAGFDEFPNEKVQDRVAAILAEWSSQLLISPQQATALRKAMAVEFLGSSLEASQNKTVNEAPPFKVWRIQYPQAPTLKSESFLAEL
jgi:hypothetical protein